MKISAATFAIKSDMEWTMVDQKVCQALSKTASTMTCYLCTAKPKEMNDLDRIKIKVVDTKSYDYVLPTLHARIHFMENTLHIAYHLEFKKWRVDSDYLKEKKEMAKNEYVQLSFREKTGLIIDVV